MKINDKLLSLPPYLSTTWTHISAIHTKGNILAVTLIDGDTVNIPALKQDVIESIFHHHADFLEKDDNTLTYESRHFDDSQNLTLSSGLGPNSNFDASLRLAFGSMDGITPVMQHNPEQANAPELPPEILNKISSIAKILAADEVTLPKPEANCNCFHCQIARAFTSTESVTPSALIEERDVINEQDLQFQQWEIHQTDDKLFTVTNKLDALEKYNVFLGQPVGCTCGKQGCEHILAVLKS